MTKTRILVGTALAPILLVGIFLLIAYVQSPPGAGRSLLAKYSLPYPTIVAHRGLSHLAPEATAPAYLLARDVGADFLEADLQRTKDGVLIALHDDTLERTTNVAQVFPGREKDTVDMFTFADLRRLDAGSWFNRTHPDRARASFANVKILSLDEIIEIAEGGEHQPGLYLETKAVSRFPGIEREVVARLRARGWIGYDPRTNEPAVKRDRSGRVAIANTPARVIFQSFEADSLAKLKELAPEVPRAYLISQAMGRKESWETLLDRARRIGVGIGPVGYLAYPWHTGPAHRRGLIVHPYTIDSPWQMRLLMQFGADGYFTNRADAAVVLHGRAASVDLEGIFRKIGF